MFTTHVSVEVHHDDMMTLDITVEEVKEIIQYMTNLKRQFKVTVGKTVVRESES